MQKIKFKLLDSRFHAVLRWLKQGAELQQLMIGQVSHQDKLVLQIIKELFNRLSLLVIKARMNGQYKTHFTFSLSRIEAIAVVNFYTTTNTGEGLTQYDFTNVSDFFNECYKTVI